MFRQTFVVFITHEVQRKQKKEKINSLIWQINMIIFRVISGAIMQAVGQLTSNKLRSFLSLLGISIGIFCIIGIKAAVNSLEDNIRGSFEKLGNDIIYISKMPWNEDPNQNYWKYQRRPQPSIKDLEAIEKKVKTAKMSAYSVFIGVKVLKFNNNNVQNVFSLAPTFDYGEIFKLKFEKGRYFSPNEYHYGSDVIILGHKVAVELFGANDPIGKEIYYSNRKMRVTGVLEETGRDIINPVNFDEAAIIPYSSARKFVNVRPRKNSFMGSSLNVKAAEGVSLEKLTDDVTGALRASRRIRPAESNDFSINEMSIVTGLLDKVFSVMNLAGMIIGGFALLVGMFSVANIMFVSVKERTNIIGIKKALGAKKSVILLEFLIESIILCVIGGALGLLTVYGTTYTLSKIFPYDFYLSLWNAMVGVIVSVVVGVLAGTIPAMQASNMDPVEAMRK
ncbi:MAG: ABC transporter permease [Saprospiraceae bacterium]